MTQTLAIIIWKEEAAKGLSLTSLEGLEEERLPCQRNQELARMRHHKLNHKQEAMHHSWSKEEVGVELAEKLLTTWKWIFPQLVSFA